MNSRMKEFYIYFSKSPIDLNVIPSAPPIAMRQSTMKTLQLKLCGQPWVISGFYVYRGLWCKEQSVCIISYGLYLVSEVAVFNEKHALQYSGETC